MVITGLTRNQLGGNPTWVRIPPSLQSKLHLNTEEVHILTNGVSDAIFYKTNKTQSSCLPPR